MMGQAEDLNELRQVARSFTDGDVPLSPNSVLRSDLGLNSYEMVQLICAVEDRFGVEIPDQSINRLKTVQDVLDFLANHG